MANMSMKKLKERQGQGYRNLWHTDLLGTSSADFIHFCFALWCFPCASYLLRKRALSDDMSRYVCCAGYTPCSGKCGESKCPKFCLGTETQHKLQLDMRDGIIGPMQAPQAQNMSRIDNAVPPSMQKPQTQNMSRIDAAGPPSVGYGGPPIFDQPVYGHPHAPFRYPSQAYTQQSYGYPQQQQYFHQPYGPYPPR